MMRDILTSLIVNAVVFTVLFAILLGVRKAMGKKISAVMQYVLWALVVIKLIIPFGFESRLSPLGIFDTSDNTAADYVQTASAGAYLQNTDRGKLLTEEPGGAQSIGTGQALQTSSAETSGYIAQSTGNTDINVRAEINWEVLIFMLWALGVLVTAALAVLDAVKLKQRMSSGRQMVSPRIVRIFCECRKELKLRKNVYLIVQSNNNVPFAINVFRPKIVLLGDIEEQSDEQIRYILMHELTHIRYGDMLIIALLNILSVLYWFNPFVWVCFRLIRKDMETACDCRVLGNLGRNSRREYIGTVLQFANRKEGRRQYAAIGMADGRMTMEQRIRGMFKTTKTGIKGRIVAACVAVLILAVSVLTACQPTPEREAVVGRQEDVLENVQTTAPDDFEPIEAPEHINETYDDFSYVKISYDADVVVPDATAYPVTKMSKRVFTEEEVLSYIDLFTDGDFEMYAGWTETKDDYLRLLTKAKQYEGTQRVTDEIIERLQKLYEKATNDIINPKIGNLSELPTDRPPHVNIRNEAGVISTFGEWNENSFGYNRDNTINARTEFMTDDSQYVKNMDGSYEYFAWKKPGEPDISQEDAYAVALECREALGVDLDLYSVQLCSFIKDYVDKTTGWQFVFTREIYGLQTIDTLGTLGWRKETAPSYGSPWGQEQLIVRVDKEGLFSFWWKGASKISSVEAQSAQLEDFDKIHQRITDQLRYNYAYTGELEDINYEIMIMRIRLGISLISLENKTDSGVYVPTWYVDYRYKLDKNDGDEWDSQQIMFNAIDGSYVEPRITVDDLMGNMDIGGMDSSVSYSE